MKLIIAGSRSVTQYQTLLDALRYFKIKRIDVEEIVSGTANGADKLGEVLAEKANIALKQFPADWDKFGKSAGYKRNVEMAEYADCLLALWDGESRGTNHMINIMKEKNKLYFVYNTKEHNK